MLEAQQETREYLQNLSKSPNQSTIFNLGYLVIHKHNKLQQIKPNLISSQALPCYMRGVRGIRLQNIGSPAAITRHLRSPCWQTLLGMRLNSQCWAWHLPFTDAINMGCLERVVTSCSFWQFLLISKSKTSLAEIAARTDWDLQSKLQQSNINS